MSTAYRLFEFDYKECPYCPLVTNCTTSEVAFFTVRGATPHCFIDHSTLVSIPAPTAIEHNRKTSFSYSFHTLWDPQQQTTYTCINSGLLTVSTERTTNLNLDVKRWIQRVFPLHWHMGEGGYAVKDKTVDECRRKHYWYTHGTLIEPPRSRFTTAITVPCA